MPPRLDFTEEQHIGKFSNNHQLRCCTVHGGRAPVQVQLSPPKPPLALPREIGREVLRDGTADVRARALAHHTIGVIVESGALYLAGIEGVIAVQIYGIAPTLIIIRVALGLAVDSEWEGTVGTSIWKMRNELERGRRKIGRSGMDNDPRRRPRAAPSVFGALAFTQALLPSFRARRAGHILNVSSAAAVDVEAEWDAYGASKAALELFSEAMSQELAPFRVRVLIIEPGHFSTKFCGASPSAGTQQSAVYTAESQGFGTLPRISDAHIAAGPIGEVGGAARLSDALASIAENVQAFEPVWSSTDVEPERLKFYAEG
ncbi:hypothetical protein B0H21DRAFT_822993 [Amylocystis lapponica]|nr:hypothetical protein B0H21DRAFT_822993 [Amylocystis lapponica]